MPLKLLAWNIQNFTLNKIDATIGDITAVWLPDGPVASMRYNSLRSDYIIDTVTLADPDIFVLIEVISAKGTKGSLVSGKGAQGLLQLLNLLRTKSDQWCLVPALKLVNKINTTEIDGEGDAEDAELLELLNEGQYTEGIGVFYRKDRLDFVGPYVWPNTPGNDAANKVAVLPGNGVTPGPYPNEWQNGLPAGNYYAGQYVYASKAEPGKVKSSPLEFPGKESRVPFLTRFVEKGGTKRVISLASVHFPPNSKNAETALARLAGYFEDVGIADNEIQVIAGDYNIDFGEEYSLARMHLVGLYEFDVAFGYGASPTMFKRASQATPTDYQHDLVLDNVAIRRGKDAIEPVGAWVINRVNAQGIPSAMWISMDQILQEPPAVQDDVFRLPMNFGRLGPVPGTSDHLPILTAF